MTSAVRIAAESCCSRRSRTSHCLKDTCRGGQSGWPSSWVARCFSSSTSPTVNDWNSVSRPHSIAYQTDHELADYMHVPLHAQWLVCPLHVKRQWQLNLVRDNKPVSYLHECRLMNSYFQCLQSEVCLIGMCSSGLQFDVTIRPTSLVLSHGSRVLSSIGDAVVVVSTARSAIEACSLNANNTPEVAALSGVR